MSSSLITFSESWGTSLTPWCDSVNHGGKVGGETGILEIES